MIAKAIEKVRELVTESLGQDAIILNNGRTLYFMNGKEVAQDFEARPDKLVLHTLTALVDFVKQAQVIQEGAEMRWPPSIIVVDDQRHITLYSSMQHIDSDRPVLAVVEPLSAFNFDFNKFMSAEQFIIGLQACFLPDVNRNAVIEAIAGIKSDDSMSLKDDGVCQMATQKRGMQLETKVQLPNPITLTPYRTFSEIEQPESSFVLRATDKRGEPEIGLWEADGAAWKNVAAVRIKAWLDVQLANTGITILG